MLKNKKDIENENRLESKELLGAMKEFDNLESFRTCFWLHQLTKTGMVKK